MHLVWETTFWCDWCEARGKDVVGKVYREESDEPLPEEEKAKVLDLLKHYHQIDNHTTCWICGKHIKPHEIAGVDWVDNEWKELCGDCA